MKLILGSAEVVHPYHERWVDATWTRIDKFVVGEGIVNMDARDLECPDGSVESIYASHLLEHFGHQEVPAILAHWFTKLQPGGWLHINVPDINWAAREILSTEPPISASFTTKEWIINGILYGSQAHEGEFHKSGYTKDILREKLLSAGYTEVTVEEDYDAHDMGVLLADAYKP